MWKSRLFGSLSLLLDFVNEHALTADQFKVLVVPPRVWQRRGSPRYHLIYQMDDPAPGLVGALATAEESPDIDEAAAIDTAAEIIASAQHRGGHGHGSGERGA
jgi:heat shock protein HspQ